jgi:hypothetical protein
MLAGMDSFPHFPLAIPGTIVVFSYEGYLLQTISF